MASRVCAFAFWFYGFRELVRGGAPFAGWELIGAHGLQLLLSVDFAYHYMKARVLGRRLTLPVSV
jgi:hypothetical protein